MIRIKLCAACSDPDEVSKRDYLLSINLVDQSCSFYCTVFDEKEGYKKLDADADSVGLTGISTSESMSGHSANLSFTMSHPWGIRLRESALPQDMLLVEALTPDGWDTLFDGFVSNIRWNEEGAESRFSSHFEISCEGAHRLLNQGWENWQGVLWASESKIGQAGMDMLKKISTEHYYERPEAMVGFLLDWGLDKILDIKVPARGGHIGSGWMSRATGDDWKTDFDFSIVLQSDWYLRQSGSFASIIRGLIEPELHEFFLTYKKGKDDKIHPTWVFRPLPFPGAASDDSRWKRLASASIRLGVDGVTGCMGANGSKNDAMRANVFHWAGVSASEFNGDQFYGKVMLGCWANEKHIQKYGYCARQVTTSLVGISSKKGDVWFQSVAPKLVERVAWMDSPLPWLEQQSRHYPWLPSRVGGLHIGKVVEDFSSSRKATGYLVSVQHSIRSTPTGVQAYTVLGLERVCSGVSALEYPDKVRSFVEGMKHQQYVTAGNGRNAEIKNWIDGTAPYFGPHVTGASYQFPVSQPAGDRMGLRFMDGQWRMHTGTDFPAPAGTSIKAPLDGQVVLSGWDAGGLGNSIQIRTIDGSLHVFGHMQSPSNLVVGAKVSGGDEIGKVGSTGHSTGPHVHWTVRDSRGKLVDPLG